MKYRGQELLQGCIEVMAGRSVAGERDRPTDLVRDVTESRLRRCGAPGVERCWLPVPPPPLLRKDGDDDTERG